MQKIKHENKMIADVFTNKLSIFTTVILMVWVLIDFDKRILVESNSNISDVKSIKIVANEVPKLNENFVKNLDNIYQAFEIENEAPSNDSALTKQKNQSGELLKFIINDNQLELKAVIFNKQGDKSINLSIENKLESYALIKVTNLKTGNVIIEKVKNNDIAFDYKLTIKRNTQVILQKQLADKVHKIVLTMYMRK